MVRHIQRNTGWTDGLLWKHSTKGPNGTHLHWETGTNEADVGRAGSSLFNPLSKYSKFAPFKGTPGADGPDSDYSANSPSASDYGNRGSSPMSAITQPMRDYATNVRNTGERLQQNMQGQGMELVLLLLLVQHWHRWVT